MRSSVNIYEGQRAESAHLRDSKDATTGFHPKKRNSDRHPTVLRAAVFVYLIETVTASSSLRAKICVAVPANVLPTSYLHTPIYR